MRIRIDNIECRNSYGRYEIVKWYPNKYYGSEESMIEEGYERIVYDNGGWALRKDCFTIHGSCFVNVSSSGRGLSVFALIKNSLSSLISHHFHTLQLGFCLSTPRLPDEP